MRVQDWFEYHANARPRVEFLRHGTRSVSYAEAELWANRLAQALIGEGLRIGDRAAWLSGNTPEMGIMFIGMAKAGIAPVMLNRHLAPREWLWILRDAAPRLVFAQGAAHVAAIETIRAELPEGTGCIALDAPAPPGWRDGAALLAAASEARPHVAVTADDLYYLIYTSGTTGHPKGVMLTHANIIAHVEQSMVASSFGRRPGARSLVATPLHHAAGALRIATAAINGTSVVLLERFDPQHYVQVLEQDRIATCNLVPSMIQRLLDEVPDIATRNFDALEVIHYGAAPISVPLLRRALDVFRCDLIQGYGLTESTGGIAYLTEHDHQRALEGDEHLLRAAGRPVVLADLRVVDAQDQEVPPGTIGELVVRGPNVMKGYWRNPDATAEALRGGWLHTGDAASFDAEGYLYLHDRLRDMVVSGGVNIYPREIENVLAAHPQIAEVAVIGIPDPRWGEALLAVCVPHGETPSQDALIAFCRERIGAYKVPRRYEFRENLPRNASGKVLKRELRRPYWESESRGVA
jgi:acyl-CoA synthetase (AMP-forming)/AMP-acid ligase II